MSANGYYPAQIGIIFYDDSVIGYTHSIIEAEEICVLYESKYEKEFKGFIQWDKFKKKYEKYCLPENLVTINDFVDKIKTKN